VPPSHCLTRGLSRPSQAPRGRAVVVAGAGWAAQPSQLSRCRGHPACLQPPSCCPCSPAVHQMPARLPPRAVSRPRGSQAFRWCRVGCSRGLSALLQTASSAEPPPFCSICLLAPGRTHRGTAAVMPGQIASPSTPHLPLLPPEAPHAEAARPSAPLRGARAVGKQTDPSQGSTAVEPGGKNGAQKKFQAGDWR